MPPETVADITPEQVSRFLKENPTFFLKHENLLVDLYLPHESGQAVSLLERQVSLLRERNIDARKRLSDILEEGQRNDTLFRKTQEMILHLLDAKSLDDMAKRIDTFLKNEFQIEFCQFCLVNNTAKTSPMCKALTERDLETTLPNLLKSSEAISGVFREEELALLFNKPDAVKSAIVLPIYQNNSPSALLVLGSSDPHYFKAGMDTLFLRFIGDVIARLLKRYI